jgi:hypothetical protein
VRAAEGAVEALEGRMMLAGSGLAGAYFNNTGLSGTAVATRIDKTVNFNWSGSPGVSGIGADNFSVRWTGQVNPRYTGAYTFLTNSDDGVRLYINGAKVIDNWTRHSPTINSGTANLTAGVKANVTMEFFESGGGATAQLMWQSKSQAKEIIPESQLSNTYTPPTNPPPTDPPPSGGTGTGDGLLGTYFDNMDFTAQKLARVDPQVNFNWGYGSPAGSVQTDTFSTRWTGQVQAQKSETYTFYTKSDDGARLTVNGKVLIDKLIPQGPTEYSGQIALAAGQRYSIQLDYMERSGGSEVSLSWSSPTTAKQVIPKAQLYSGNVATPEKPGTPGGFAATAVSSSQIRLNWQDVSNETSYKLERSADGVNGWTQIATPGANATTYTDSNLAANTKYYYRLRANNSAGDSAYTAVVNSTTPAVTPPTEKPATPGGFVATTLSASQVRLNWQDVADETSYKLERSPDGTTGWAQIATPGANATSYTDSNLAASTKYYYRLRANNSAGDSGYTAVANATTQAVTPPPTGGKYQPDQVIQIHKETSFVGDNVYNATGDGQGRSATGDFYTTVFKIRVFNDGDTADSFVITGPAADKDWRVTYYDSFNFGWDGGKTITAAVTGGGWNTGVIQPGQFRDYRMEVLALAAPGGTSRTFEARARSVADSSKVDVVEGTVTNPAKASVSWRRQNFDTTGTYLMKIENQGNLPDQFTISTVLGSGFGSTWNVQYFDDQWGGNDVTGAVRSGGGWRTRVLQPYESQEFRVVFGGYSDPKAPSVQVFATSVARTDIREGITVNMTPDNGPAVTSDFFPIGVWTQPVSSFDKWKGRGVNTLVGYQGDGATMEQWSQAARNRDMYYIRDALPRDRRYLDAADDHLLAWALPDEPEITTRYPASDLKNWVEDWKQTDPNKPIWANFSGGYVLRWQGNVAGPGGYKPYQDLLDWDSSSIYPVTGWYRPDEHPGLDAPGRAIDQLEKWSNGHPQFAVLEPSDQELNWIQQDIPGPTPGQFRAEVWDSIVRGARGVIYFPMSFKPSFRFDNTSPEVAAEMTATNAKIQSIARVLQSDIDPPTRGLQADAPLEGTWRVVDGKTYYVVLNFSNQAVTASMTLQGIGNALSASVHGEGRSVSLVNGTFTDTFGAYSVHVYEVAAAGGAAREVAAASAQVVRGAAPGVGQAFAVTRRIGVSVLEEDGASFDERIGA